MTSKLSSRKKGKPLPPELNSALQLYKLGLLEEAESLFQKFVLKYPVHADALHFCGLTAHSLGRHVEAVDYIERAIAIDPRRAVFHLNLSLCLAALGQRSAIEHLSIAVGMQPDLIDGWYNLGVLYSQEKSDAAAETSYRKLLALAPNHLNALNNLGELLSRMGRNDEAASLLSRALELSPGFTDAQYNLARLILDEEPAKAAQLLDCVTRARPQWIDAYRLYSKAQAKNGAHTSALATLMRVLEKFPAEANLQNDIGLIQLEMGDLVSSRRAFENALEIDPTHVHALYNLAFSVKAEQNSALLAKVNAVIATAGGLPSELQAMLHFAAGHLHEAAQHYDAAFSQFEQANKLKGAVYVAKEIESHFAAIKTVFTPELFSQYGCKNDAAQPVFIVGMPRSGTTLTEQIVASHPQAAGVGELILFNQISTRLSIVLKTQEPYPACISLLNCEIANQLAQGYLEELWRRGGKDALRISDKMPGNFVHLGLIALLFPRAKIIHCQRNPLDTCLSCFTANFTGSLPYAYNQTHLGHYYRSYQDLMAHWEEVLPIPIHKMEYERLIDNPEAEIRKLIHYLDLPWSDDCLTPHQTVRAVTTASNVQIRKPIYRHAVNRSARYATHLDALRKALSDGVC